MWNLVAALHHDTKCLACGFHGAKGYVHGHTPANFAHFYCAYGFSSTNGDHLSTHQRKQKAEHVHGSMVYIVCQSHYGRWREDIAP